MSTTEEMKTLYQALKTSFQDKVESGNILDFQKEAWGKFEHIGLPHRKAESYQYVPLKKLFANLVVSEDPQTPPSLPEIIDDGHPSLCFINGTLILECSNTEDLPKGVLILPMKEALTKFGPYLKGRWDNMLKREQDPFALANQALSTDGKFIYIPPKVCFNKSLRIRHYITATSGHITPSLYLFSGEGSKASITQEIYRAEDSKCLYNSFIDLHLERNAHIDLSTTREGSLKAFDLTSLRASLKRKSNLEVIDFCTEAMSRSDYYVSLNEPDAYASLSGLWIGSKNKQSHAHIFMEHKAPDCISSQLFKGVLTEHSRSSFEGKIYIHPDAQKTEAYQSNHNLLLSDTSFAASKPNLEIFADDVKASHGSTTGQIDKEQIFYLRTRGIPENIAKQLLVKAFCQEVIDLLRESEFKKFVSKKIISSLKKALNLS